jgi:hypothetical protein
MAGEQQRAFTGDDGACVTYSKVIVKPLKNLEKIWTCVNKKTVQMRRNALISASSKQRESAAKTKKTPPSN